MPILLCSDLKKMQCECKVLIVMDITKFAEEAETTWLKEENSKMPSKR